jgi:excisionase family DNA binding protein
METGSYLGGPLESKGPVRSEVEVTPVIRTTEQAHRDAVGAADLLTERLINTVAEGVYRGLSRWNAETHGSPHHTPPNYQDSAALLNAAQAAALLGLRVRRVYELTGRGILPSVRIGRQIRFRRQALETWMAQRELVNTGS